MGWPGNLLQSIWYIASFWYVRFWAWLRRPSPVKLGLYRLDGAETFEEWENAAYELDELLALRATWRDYSASKHYDWRLIEDRLEMIMEARQSDDTQHLLNLLRSGLLRNFGNITSPKLYNKAFAGTKVLIEDYVAQVAGAIGELAEMPAIIPTINTPGANEASETPTEGHAGSSGTSGVAANVGAFRNAWSIQSRLDFVYDTRQAFGRSTLLLQGGSIFGLCHLGVVKALFLRGLLPRIITGTATGALIASLVAIHTDEELPAVLKGDGIDLSAFSAKAAELKDSPKGNQSLWSRWETLLRRVQRFRNEGYFLDVKVLEECVRANVGDLTFEEAYNRSKRVLNITVATAEEGGLPTLLNYLTTPHVLIWTAAVASNASSTSLYGDRRTMVLCKDAHGNIVPWAPANTVNFRHWTQVPYAQRYSPFLRISELFNVNHVIISQARPYLVPFLQSDMHGPSLVATRSRMAATVAFVMRLVGLELRHRLRQLDTLQLLPLGIRRFLVDERIPGASITLVPEVTAQDFVRLLETPTRETLDYWIGKGERSVWPAVAALRIRLIVEMELDRAYQATRRVKPQGLRRKNSTNPAVAGEQQQKRNRARASSAGARGWTGLRSMGSYTINHS